MTYNESRRRVTAKVVPGALRAVIEFNGLTYQEVADRSRVSKGTIGNLLSGSRTTLNPETAKKIADGLRVNVTTLFDLVEIEGVDSTAHKAAWDKVLKATA